ncbi:MAG: DNA polymerase III subunit delta' [Candidatus Omnitrophica bacterium]|nr:DNA polymerase III subunit delta' [Candidatus Omnitrophota bacterium]
MSFKDIKGQDRPIEILKNCIKSSKLTGAYLFLGEEGIGKYLVAKTLAKAVNCLSSQDDSYDTCSSCLKIERNQHPDIHFIEPEDSEAIKIEYIRDLKKDINLRPYEAKQKVFIINDAHRLTAEAANALLKTLEEPPAHSLIILISSKAALLFKTIISRCKIIRFYPLDRAALTDILKKDYSLDNNLAHFLAYFFEGRIGNILRFKDTDILRDKNRVIDEFTIFKKPGIESLSVQSKDTIRSYLNILASWFRDIYFIKSGMPHSQLINLDRKDELLRVMNRYSWLELDESLNSISDSLMALEQNINVKLLLSNLRIELWRE